MYAKADPQAREISADTATLDTIATWKADLRVRYERAKLIWELIGGNGPEIEAISAEMAQFTKLCKALKEVQA